MKLKLLLKEQQKLADIPGRPKDSKSRTHFAVSSATPHEYPLAFVALLTVVSISLNDFMIKY